MNQNGIEACTSYMACGIAFHIPEVLSDVNWTTVGAVILLIARLLKDVPEAYDAVVARLRKRKEKKDQ